MENVTTHYTNILSRRDNIIFKKNRAFFEHKVYNFENNGNFDIVKILGVYNIFYEIWKIDRGKCGEYIG